VIVKQIGLGEKITIRSQAAPGRAFPVKVTGIELSADTILVSQMIRSSSMVTCMPLLSGRWPRQAPRPSRI